MKTTTKGAWYVLHEADVSTQGTFGTWAAIAPGNGGGSDAQGSQQPVARPIIVGPKGLDPTQ